MLTLFSNMFLMFLFCQKWINCSYGPLENDRLRQEKEYPMRRKCGRHWTHSIIIMKRELLNELHVIDIPVD